MAKHHHVLVLGGDALGGNEGGTLMNGISAQLLSPVRLFVIL